MRYLKGSLSGEVKEEDRVEDQGICLRKWELGGMVCGKPVKDIETLKTKHFYLPVYSFFVCVFVCLFILE